MRRANWQVAWLLMSVVACSGLAGSESADGPAFAGGAGQGNEGGSDSDAVGGAGGAGAVVAGAAGEGGGNCGGQPKNLAEYCARNGCPETPDDVDLNYCDVDSDFAPFVTRGPSSCGGVSVSMSNMWEGTTYHFDNDGQLVGVSWSSDYIDDCPHSVGRECLPQGPQTVLCGELERCAAVELVHLCSHTVGVCSELDRPPTMQQLCAEGETVERFASSCGGSVFRQQSGAKMSEWTFDDQGELVGVVLTSDALESCWRVLSSKVAVYGSPCEATGEGEDQCSAGGQGGSMGGGGGSGGAPN